MRLQLWISAFSLSVRSLSAKHLSIHLLWPSRVDRLHQLIVYISVVHGETRRPACRLTYSRIRRFEADSIVDCISKSLFAAKAPFRRLDAHIAKRELDLLKLSACFVTQTRARAAKVARSHIPGVSLDPNPVWLPIRGPGHRPASTSTAWAFTSSGMMRLPWTSRIVSFGLTIPHCPLTTAANRPTLSEAIHRLQNGPVVSQTAAHGVVQTIEMCSNAKLGSLLNRGSSQEMLNSYAPQSAHPTALQRVYDPALE